MASDKNRLFVEGIQLAIGRKMNKEELSTIQWLSGSDPSTVNSVLGIIKAAYNYGKETK